MKSLKENIKGIEWAKFVAILEIVRGALSIFSIFTIPLGVLEIFAGVNLWNTANYLEKYKSTESEEDLREAFKNLSEYFKWMGWLNLVSLILIALFLILAILLIGFIWYIVGLIISTLGSSGT
ncbi:MAG: DUF5362 family protein [Candidatus Caldipriscus sp.]